MRAREAFEVFEPATRESETPVVVEVPHAGLDLAPQDLEPLAAPARAIARDADLYVDALYEDAAAQGASAIVARASRYVVDVNRAETDVDGDVVEGARGDVSLQHGLVWRTTSEGEPALARKLSRVELEERLERVWRPYHRTLAGLVERKRARFGLCVVLAAHSMPSVERRGARVTGGGGSGSSDKSANNKQRADVVPGTRGRRSAAGKFIDFVEEHARRRGWSVRHDDPYAGGFTTQHYGRPEQGVHVVQVELARRLYLDEVTLRPGPDFEGVRRWCRELVAELGRLAST
jgi:N-formylglutamate amidohydrolase